MSIFKIDNCNKRSSKSVSIWLFICSFMVILMIGIGGYTRLEKAGLSIVEWKPISGILYPKNDSEWHKEFSHYKLYPEYKKKNFSISLEEFKKLYWIEYFHRLIGRATGCVFLIPFIFFIIQKKIITSDIYKAIMILLLGVCQGFIGWYMVKSGLVNNPHVSQYRLTAHLLMAILIYSLLVWQGLSIYRNHIDINHLRYLKIRKKIISLFVIIVLQIVLGGFLAGLNGGMIYNSFPLMDGEVIPKGAFDMLPWYINFFDNITLIQFLHRSNAIAIVFFSGYIFLLVKKYNFSTLSKYFYPLFSTILLQFAIGILTLINFVPTGLALLHQLIAIILITNLLLILHKLFYNATQKSSDTQHA